MSEKTYMTTREFAKMLQLNEVTVRRWLRSGKLPCLRLASQWRIIMPDALNAIPKKGTTID